MLDGSEPDWTYDDGSAVACWRCGDEEVLKIRRPQQASQGCWRKRSDPGGRDWNFAGDMWLGSRLRSHFRAVFLGVVEWMKKFYGDGAVVGPG